VSTTPHADMLEETARLLAMADERKLLMRVTGGIAVALHADDGLPESLRRPWKDIDFATVKGSSRGVTALFEAAGYEADRQFNALNGHRRLLFFDQANRRQVDIFVGTFQMCHEIPLTQRLELEPVTIPLAELLLTKLQIIELNEKDQRDILALLASHDVGSGDAETINADLVARLCANDWGLWRTVKLNVERSEQALPGYEVPADARARIGAGLRALWERIEREPKPTRWRLRDRVGDRVRWYEEPEEVA
jgi:hypothetical protein